jgi:hypothetical protein
MLRNRDLERLNAGNDQNGSGMAAPSPVRPAMHLTRWQVSDGGTTACSDSK